MWLRDHEKLRAAEKEKREMRQKNKQRFGGILGGSSITL